MIKNIKENKIYKQKSYFLDYISIYIKKIKKPIITKIK